MSKARPDALSQRLELDTVLGYTPEFPNSAFLEFAYPVTTVFGSMGRIPVKLTVDGHVFRSSLAPMGGKHMMVFNREMREATGYKAGDRIHVILERDIEPRTVDIPADAQQALAQSKLSDAFSRFPYTHQKEAVAWINEAKKPETRERRIAKLVQTLKDGGKP